MLWGSRFKEKLNTKALKFSSSLSIDIELFEEDILVSQVHSEMLYKIGLITKQEQKKIISGLLQIKNEFHTSKWKPNPNKFEDIHSAIESRLFEIIGGTAGKLHTGRSRNDQVATDTKLWAKKAAKDLMKNIQSFQKSLLNISERNINTIIPGYTHLQRAQPISFAFHLLAYIEMLERDKKRFLFVKNESDESPLGSGALAGSTLPLDRDFTAKKLGFKEPTRNTLDSVSDRDFILDFLNSISVGMMHLSRLAEELILWTSSEWKLVKIPEQFTTGSSLMPQKKNPDMAELIRGRSGKIFGNYLSLLTTLKGLPLSYNRDMQEDKAPLFESFYIYSESLQILTRIFSDIIVNKNRFIEELKNSFILATDLADWLVLQGIPFRGAHHIVGELVKYCEENNKSFAELTLDEMKKYSSVFTKEALAYLTIETSLKRKKTFGSPNPTLVKKQIGFWKKELSKE
jgi:argininosuccinate lyase